MEPKLRGRMRAASRRGGRREVKGVSVRRKD